MSDSDPIVDEVRQVRDAHAARFNYDLEAIFRDIKEQEKRSGRRFISFRSTNMVPAPEALIEPNKTLLPAGPA